MVERKQALELAIAGGLVAIGCAAGGPVTALVNAISGVGGNWAADLAINGYRTWSDAWLTPQGALNNDLRKSLARAFSATFRDLHQDYLNSDAYKKLAHRDRDAAKLAQEQLNLLPDEIDTLFAEPEALALVVREQARPLLAAGLLERSLTPGRFSLHQVLAAWAAALLAETPEEAKAAALAHARHYRTIVANWDDAIKRGEMTYSAPREWEQVTRAWEWLVRQYDDESTAVLLEYARHWRNVIYNNHDPRREKWLAAAYRAAEQLGDQWGQANVLQARAQFAASAGELDKALALLAQARVLYTAIGDQSGLANVSILMARIAAAQGDLAAAIAHLQPAADFGKAIGHPLGDQLQAQIDAWRAQVDSEEG